MALGQDYIIKLFFSDESKLFSNRSGQHFVRKLKEESWSSRPEFT
jgi:hypothetical protein